ncbi:hypothetical protein OEA41_009119 [Lepraria neglecta]|uniref:Amino acid transporter n=1 Tax=Lepraria neglecta TaxID=209136 RepID=A0AAE0DHR6_9LECA|nr:hypothetical protein OEA41_009119 [Lepraria neglecta]
MHSSDMAKGNDGFVETTKFGTENSSSDIQMQDVHGDVEIVADKWQGWLLATGWQGSVVGLSFLAGTIIQGLIALNHESYVPQRWHGTLLVIAVVTFCIIFNTSLAKKLPLVEGFILLVHVIGLFAIVVPLWVLSPRNDARTALLTFSNGGNWPTMGVAFMIGLLTSLGSMMGFDCAVHMSEEVKNASETLPRAIMWGVALNALLGYVTVLTLCFTVTDSTAVLSGNTGYPFIQHFYNVTNSFAGTDILTAIIIITLVSAVISEIATASRQIWSFARDNGLPFSPFLKRVNPGWNVPLNAVWVSFASGVAISLINIGSAVALNAIISLTISALLASYIISISCFLSKRLRREPLPPAKFSLGRWGMTVNIVALIFLISFFIFCFFPIAKPVTAQTMNWNIAMFGGITIFATVYYIIIGHKQYRPPVDIQNRDL